MPLLLLLAERMRHAGRYTMADVLALRLSAGRVRVASAISTMCIAAMYVVAQSVAAGSLVEALVGIPYSVAVLLTGVAILIYVTLGGMLATTWGADHQGHAADDRGGDDGHLGAGQVRL